MPTKRLSHLLQGVDAQPLFFSDSDPDVTGIEYDSREVSVGDLFVAIHGGQADGHDYIDQAIERGAVAVIVEREITEPQSEVPIYQIADGRAALADIAAEFYDHPTRELVIVGVTGTKGKSSTCHMCAAVLGEHQTELVSTITNALNRDVEQTTPEATTLQRIAAEALATGKKCLVIEASAHALAQERVRAVDFDIAIFTNLSHDHFDYFSDRDDYLSAKAKLFEGLAVDATAILNNETDGSAELEKGISAKVISYGVAPNSDIEGKIQSMNMEGTHISVRALEHSFDLFLKLPGEVFASNAMAAVGVGLLNDVPVELIKERLETVQHIEGRFERFSTIMGSEVVVDFAHSPDSLEQMLLTLDMFYSRVITLFGCGGDSDQTKRPKMGEISGKLSAVTILTNDNPKHEDPMEILLEIEAGIAPTGADYEIIPDRKEAIDRALELAEPSEVILIAGKGHERKQYFDGFEIDFNDREYLIERGVIQPKAQDGSSIVKT
jgi:UDP-N-acetylmuramoyl-L-alanyl-D-glutamate--2,6-diaminopimelate ligase